MELPEQHNKYPIFNNHDDRRLVARAIRAEILAAALGATDRGRIWPEIQGKPDRAMQLGNGFWHARVFRQSLETGRYWVPVSLALDLADPGLDDINQGDTQTVGLLLQLVILSRMAFEPAEVLNPERMDEEIELLRAELGVVSEPGGYFPGVTHDIIVDAICDGRVRIGVD